MDGIKSANEIEKQNKYIVFQSLLWFIVIFTVIFVFIFQKNTEIICFILLLFFQIFLTGFFVKSYYDKASLLTDIFTKTSWLGLFLAGLLHIASIFILVIFFVDRYVKYGDEPPDISTTYKYAKYNEQMQLYKKLLITIFACFIVSFVILITVNSNIKYIAMPLIIYALGASAYEVYIASHFTKFISRRPI